MWFFFALWAIFQPEWMTMIFAGWVWNLAVFSLVVGNLLAVALNMLAIVARRDYELIPYASSNPLYWCMHSIAAYIALWQLIRKPFYWEKTDHGLTSVETDHLFAPEMATAVHQA